MKIKLFVIDVDGTMTDSGIYYDEHGNEWKKFSTRDAAGFFAAKAAGIRTAVLTGRTCEATTRRMRELHVDYLFQNVKDKAAFLRDFLQKQGLSREEVGYIGDDFNDLAAMSMAGFIGCPADSCREVKQIATYISPVEGGHGAVRDVIENLLREEGRWNTLIAEAFPTGV